MGDGTDSDDRFERHLDRAERIVSTWPEWKQSLLGPIPDMEESMEQVNLAFASHWICDRCGLINFVRPTPREMTQEDISKLQEEAGIESWQDNMKVTSGLMPTKAVCRGCGKDVNLVFGDEERQMENPAVAMLAFYWWCPECGKLKFELPVSLPPSEAEKVREEAGVLPWQVEFMEGELITCPDVVRCWNCKTRFTTHDPNADDPIGDLPEL